MPKAEVPRQTCMTMFKIPPMMEHRLGINYNLLVQSYCDFERNKTLPWYLVVEHFKHFIATAKHFLQFVRRVERECYFGRAKPEHESMRAITLIRGARFSASLADQFGSVDLKDFEKDALDILHVLSKRLRRIHLLQRY